MTKKTRLRNSQILKLQKEMQSLLTDESIEMEHGYKRLRTVLESSAKLANPGAKNLHIKDIIENTCLGIGFDEVNSLKKVIDASNPFVHGEDFLIEDFQLPSPEVYAKHIRLVAKFIEANFDLEFPIESGKKSKSDVYQEVEKKNITMVESDNKNSPVNFFKEYYSQLVRQLPEKSIWDKDITDKQPSYIWWNLTLFDVFETKIYAGLASRDQQQNVNIHVTGEGSLQKCEKLESLVRDHDDWDPSVANVSITSLNKRAKLPGHKLMIYRTIEFMPKTQLITSKFSTQQRESMINWHKDKLVLLREVSTKKAV